MIVAVAVGYANADVLETFPGELPALRPIVLPLAEVLLTSE